MNKQKNNKPNNHKIIFDLGLFLLITGALANVTIWIGAFVATEEEGPVGAWVREILLPILGLTVTGDGTLKGRLQTFVSYGFSLTSLLLSFLTIIVSIYTITSDIEHRQIYTVVTKPIRRSHLILGKLLGVSRWTSPC
jgi:ABC-type transport system involved in multi-copper enzyme maturation permease subunit